MYIIFILSISICTFYYLLLKTKPPKDLKSIYAPPFFKSLYILMTNSTLTAMQKLYFPNLFKHGSILSWYLGKWWVVIADPEEVKNIFKKNGLTEKMLFHEISNELLVVEYMGENILYSHTEEWKRHRRIVIPAFQKPIPLSSYKDSTERMIQTIYQNIKKPIDIHTLLSKATLEILGEAILGLNFDKEGEIYSVKYNIAAKAVAKQIYFLLPFLEKWNIQSRRIERNTVREFRKLMTDLIIKKASQIKMNNKENKGDATDLLSMMIEASINNNKNKIMSFEELVNNTIVMFAAGHDTTANTMSFTLYHLAKNPDIQYKLRTEIQNIIKQENNEGFYMPNMEELNQMRYLEAVIYESMRITPTLPQIRRRLDMDYIMKDGTFLPKNTLIILQTYAIMNNPNYISNPNLFQPERFLDKSKYPFHNFYGFGAGSRVCIGQQMSLIEQKILLFSIIKRFHISLPINSIHHEKLITLGGVVVRPKELNLIFNII